MKDDNQRLLFQYAGLAMQLFVSLGLAVLIGIWVDKKIGLKFPLLIWLLPLLVIAGMITKAIRDTSTKK